MRSTSSIRASQIYRSIHRTIRGGRSRSRARCESPIVFARTPFSCSTHPSEHRHTHSSTRGGTASIISVLSSPVTSFAPQQRTVTDSSFTQLANFCSHWEILHLPKKGEQFPCCENSQPSVVEKQCTSPTGVATVG